MKSIDPRPVQLESRKRKLPTKSTAATTKDTPQPKNVLHIPAGAIGNRNGTMRDPGDGWKNRGWRPMAERPAGKRAGRRAGNTPFIA